MGFLTRARVCVWRSGELYIIDLGSVHGTVVNKERLKPRTYAPLVVGSVVKFGESTRLYNVLGPEDMQPPEETTYVGFFDCVVGGVRV